MLKTVCLVVLGASVAAIAAADVCSPQAAVPGRSVQLLTAFYGPAGIGICTDNASDILFRSVSMGLIDFQQGFTTPLTTALASTIASLPVPSAASSFTYAYDPAAGVFRRSTQSFGPILGDRAETMGKGRVGVGFAYQHFKFVRSEFGVVVNAGSDAPGEPDSIETNRVTTIDIGQFVGFLNYAPTDRIDLALAVPLTHVELGQAGNAVLRRPASPSPAYDPNRHYFPGHANNRTFSTARSSSGIGDVTLRAKFNAVRSGRKALAVGADLRFPTGEALDLLGSGAFGLRPFIVVSYGNRVVSPHLKVAYDWGGKSVLAGNLTPDGNGGVMFEQKRALPNKWLMHVGADIAVHPRATLSVEFLGSVAVNDYTFSNGAYRQTVGGDGDVAVGLKLNPFGKLLVDLNLLFYNPHDFTEPSPHPSALVGIEYGF